jgi:hypothetical protein
MAMKNSVAREYLQVHDHIRYGRFRGHAELEQLQRQKATLHGQLNELCGHRVTVAEARQIARRSR